jgi:C4-dicarboxylate transporter, DctQ subunit
VSVGALLAALDRLARWGFAIACVLVVAMLCLIFTEVLARKLFATSLEFAWEWAAYLLAISLLLGSGHTLRAGLHVRVQLALSALGPRRARWLDAAATALGVLAAGFLALALVRLTVSSYTGGTRSFLPSNTLLWPFQAGFALGAVLLALQFVARLVRLARGEMSEAAAGGAPLVRAE